MTMSTGASSPASIVCSTGETRSVTGPVVGTGVSVAVRVGVIDGVEVIVGVRVIVGVGQPSVGHGVGEVVGVGESVDVGVSVIVGVGGSTTWMEPPTVVGLGSTEASTEASVTPWSVRELAPAALPWSVKIARMPDPEGPGGDAPSVLHTNVRDPGDVGGWLHETERPVLPKNGPAVTPAVFTITGS